MESFYLYTFPEYNKISSEFIVFKLDLKSSDLTEINRHIRKYLFQLKVIITIKM